MRREYFGRHGTVHVYTVHMRGRVYISTVSVFDDLIRALHLFAFLAAPFAITFFVYDTSCQLLGL